MLSPEVLKKLDAIESRFEELTHQLSDPGVVSSGERYRKVAKERASVEAAVTSLRAYRKLLADIADNEAFLAEKDPELREDRKSTRLNSSHSSISYAVFCLKKKKKK